MQVAPRPSRAVYLRRRLIVGLAAVAVVGGGLVGVARTLDSDGGRDALVAASTTTTAPTTGTAPAPATPPASATAAATAPASATAAATVVTTTLPAGTASASTETATTETATSATAATTPVQDALPIDPAAPAVDAAAHGVYDWTSGVWLTAADADVRRPVGSIMKLLTAHVVMQAGDPGKVVTVPALTLDPQESAIGLYAGERLPRDVLLRAILIVSANDAAEALAIDVGGTRDGFVAMMNQAAGDLGLDDTVAANPSGLDGGDAVSTVRDVVTLAAELMKDETFRATVARPTARLHGQTFPATNELLGTYPGADGIKTGSTTQAGYGVVASATRDGRTVIVAVLGAPTDASRFASAAALLDWAFSRAA